MLTPSRPLERIYGKILLFGEYTILLRGEALAVPLHISKFSGNLTTDGIVGSDPGFKNWQTYLLNIKDSILSELDFDWNQLDDDIRSGLHFESGIPMGYGLGSSGALTAAVLKKYLQVNQLDIFLANPGKLQKMLAHFESFFHGSSSGLDPLVSILNAPVLVSGTSAISVPELNPDCFQNWYIIDSGASRQTSVLVESFKNLLAEDSVFEQKMQELKSANHLSIRAFINHNTDQLISGLQQISLIQFEQLNWLIPDGIKTYWDSGLKSGRYYFKLCGAGGGGYYLAYIPEKKDYKRISKELCTTKISM